MPTTVQFRRGTTSQNNSFTGAAGELTIDTDKNTIIVHDNATAGGTEIVNVSGTQTLTNKTLTAPDLTSPTIGGVAIAEYISDTVGAMVSSNTESGISVTYQDADNTLDFDVGDFTITLGGDLTGSATITNLGSATLTATIVDDSHNHIISNVDGLQTALDAKLALAGGTMSGNIAMGSNSITGLADPSSNQDAATKAYVDSGLSSLSSTTLTEGNSTLVVADSGTGTITATIDGATHSTFAAAGITLAQGEFIGDVTGNADTADAWSTARTLSLTGAVTGSASIDGSGNVSLATTATSDPTLTLAGDASGSATFTNLGSATLTVTVADDSHNHVTSNIDGLAEYIADTVGAMVSGNTESGITVSYDDTDNTLDFTIGTLNQNTSGNAATASAWETARTLSLTGAVTGSASIDGSGNVSLTTTATSDPTITLAGDLSGSATLTNLGSATLTATIAANSVALGTDTTGNYIAGISGGTGVSVSGSGSESATATISIGQAVATNSNVTFNNLTLSGDLTVNGTTTTVATTNTVISDNLIELNNGAASNANDSGIIIERGSTGDNAFIGWDESADKFILGTTTATGASTGDLSITAGTVVASTFEGALSGNATTASAWQTARTLSLTGAVTGSASVDGSGNVSLATTATSDPTITLTGAVTGSGTMTNLGNVSIATTATADPTLTLSGDASGSATFTNLGNATLTVTVADDSHNHIISNVDGLQAALDAKQAASTAITTSNISSQSVSSATSATNATNASYVYVEDDASTAATRYITFVDNSTAGNKRLNEDANLTYNPSTNVLTTGTFSGALSGNATTSSSCTGNAATATTLQTARTIGGVSFNGSANINLPGVNTTGNQNTSGSSASCTGNAATATTLQTARTINGVSFNGSANITVEPYISDDDTGDTNCPVLFSATSTAGYKRIYEDSAFYFNNTANTLVATNFSGTATAAKYADLAERYTSDSNYDAGTVLVFGGDEEVTESSQRLDRRVAGIVSTDPAYLMNSELENSVAVGLQGRVPCKVVGEIRKGDMMVTSATPGHAEAWREESDPPMGSVIGKALENKTGAGTDVIEVVVGRL